MVQTGTGGFHVYLRKPKNLKVRKNLEAYPGIDFLSGNHFAVGAESIHPDTRQPYRAVIRSPKDICSAPATILGLVEKVQTVDLAPTPSIVDNDPINIERFIEILANMPVVPKGNQRNSAYVAACRGRDLGLSQDVCASSIHTHYNGVKLDPPITPEEVDETVKNAYRYAQGQIGNKNVSAIFQTAEVGEQIDIGKVLWDKNDKHVLTKTLNNAVNHIVTVPGVGETFRYNVFTGGIEINSKAPWYAERGSKSEKLRDSDFRLLKYHLSKNFSMEYPVPLLEEAVTVVAHKRHYHPVQNYLKTLVWDGKPRLDNWLTVYAGATENAYTRAIGRKTLCAAVRRIFEPGCKFDYMLIIEGDQGIGKSQLVGVLGRLWSGRITLDPHSKDTIHKMNGKWVIEIAELNGIKWSEANALKAFLDTQTDTVRLSYERHAADIRRQSIFIGTVNPEHIGYLSDPTGNRRYWMVRASGPVKLIEFENDCNQLWAEVMEVYQKEVLYLTGEADRMQKIEAQKRMPEEPYKNSVQEWIRQNSDRDEARVTEVLEYLGVPAKNQSRGDLSRIAQVFAELGWERQRRTEGDSTGTFYVRPMKERLERAMDRI